MPLSCYCNSSILTIANGHLHAPCVYFADAFFDDPNGGCGGGQASASRDASAGGDTPAPFATSEPLHDDDQGDAVSESAGGSGGRSSGHGHTAATTTLPEPDIEAAISFIKKLFPGSPWPGHALLWTLDPASQKKRSHWFASPEEVEKGIQTNANLWRTQNVYVGMGMSAPGLRRGTGPGDLSPHRRLLKEEAVDKQSGTILPNPAVHFIPGLWADIDYGEDGHKATNGKVYARDEAAVWERLPDIPIMPTIIVHSGHGLQMFWLFDHLLDISCDRASAAARQAGWVAQLKEIYRPYALDSVIDLARVMRLPGFINNKDPKLPVGVRVISADGPRTTPDAVDEILASYRGKGGGRKDRRPDGSSTEDPFTFDPDSEGDWDKFQASYDSSSRFAGAWDGDRPDLADQSASGYDMALANAASHLGWTKEETLHLLAARRRKAGAKPKQSSYYERTVGKAFSSKQRNESGARSAKQGKGGANRGGRATSQKTNDFAAAQRYIQQVVQEQTTIYWLQEFYQIQRGTWRLQSEEFFRKTLHGVIAEARHSGGHPIVTRETIASCMQSLAVAVTPPCIDTALLPAGDRLRNFDLDTGEPLNGSAFANGVVKVSDDGSFQLLERDARHFYTTARPYSFPEKRPPRPEFFDLWLEGRLPDQDTRVAFWEVLGATVAQQLHAQQRIVVLVGEGRAGKGTALKVACMLVGRHHTATFTGGPARMARSQFSLSGLDRAALVILPNMPPPPIQEGYRKDHFVEGLACLMSISGGDPILVERKHRDPITAVVDASVWVDTNHSLSGVIQGEEDAYAWAERIIPIPFRHSINEDQREPDYERKFEPELGQIAWYAIEGFAKALARRHYTWSTEMTVERVRLHEGKDGPLQKFFQQLYFREGSRILRSEVRRAADLSIGQEIGNERAAEVFRYAENIRGVRESKVNGERGFKNLAIKKPDRC